MESTDIIVLICVAGMAFDLGYHFMSFLIKKFNW